MNQVAVVIGGGQTYSAFLCHSIAARGIASRLSIFRATKPQMWHKSTPILVKVSRTVLVLTPLTSKAFWRSLRGVDEILVAWICWSIAPE